MEFSPNFTTTTPVWANSFIVNSCINIFSFSTESNLQIVSYDPMLARSILEAVKNQMKTKKKKNANKSLHSMNILAVIFDFYQLLSIDNSKLSLVLTLRKLFAVSFYLPQIDFTNMNQVINPNSLVFQLNEIIQNLLNDENNEDELKTICAASFSYSLSAIVPVMKNIKALSEMSNENTDLNHIFIDLLKYSFQLYDKYSSFATESQIYFSMFFLSILLLFSPSSTDHIYDDILNQALIKSLETLSINSDINSNENNLNIDYGYIINHLISFLNSDLSIKIQINALKVVSFIVKMYPKYTSYLFNFTSFEIVSLFFKNLISNVNLSFEKKSNNNISIIKICDQIRTKNENSISFNELIDSKTFLDPIPFDLEILDEHDDNEASNPPDDLKSFNETPYFPELLEVIFMLCKLSTTASHPQFLKKLIFLFKKDPTFSFLAFILMWGRNYIITSDDALEQLYKIEYFDFILNTGFGELQCDEYINFICKLFPYILCKNPNNAMFLYSLFSKHENTILELNLTPSLNICIEKCCKISPKLVSNFFSTTFYAQKLSNLLFYFQFAHIRFQEIDDTKFSRELLTKIPDIRRYSLEYISFLLKQDIYCDIILKSSKFMNILLNHFFEPMTNSFASHYLSICLKRITYNDGCLFEIFNSFQNIFTQVQSNNKLKPFTTQALEIISKSFEINSESIAFIFLNTDFFPSLVDYVCSIKSRENMYFLLNIAKKCASLKGSIADYVSEIDLFSKLYPLIATIFNNNIPEEFINHLWSIVLGESNSNIFDDINSLRKKSITNAAPLTLIFKLLKNKDDKTFLHFINALQAICDEDFKSAVEVNNSDLPALLIETFDEYHHMTEKDTKFDSILNLFSSLASRSLKIRDALSFFHIFSPIDGKFLPFYTNDILKSLIYIFQSPYDSPYALYHVDKSNGIIYLPSLSVRQPIRDFTFFIQIEFTEKPVRFAVLFSIEIGNSSFSLYLKNSKLFFEYSNNNNSTSYSSNAQGNLNQQEISNSTNGSFDYVFPPHAWTHIAVTFSDGTISLFVHGKEQAKLRGNKFYLPIGTISNCCVARNLSCNIGNFGFVQKALQANIVNLLASLPKTSVTSYSPAEASNFSYDLLPLFQGNIYLNSIYIYNPAISLIKSKTSINLGYVPISKNQLRIEGQIYGYSPQVKDMLRSIGGASSLLPIFSQIDSPFLPRGSISYYQTDSTLLPVLIQVLIAFLRNSQSNQEDFAAMNGFMIIGYLLSRSRIENITPQVIELFKRLYKEIIVPTLAYQMLESIFLDIRLWIYLPYDLQVVVYQSILELFHSSSDEKKKWFLWAVPFNKILYIMRVFFWTYMTDEKICLYGQPLKYKRLNDDGSTLAEVVVNRPQNMIGIRDIFWKLANEIYTLSFNSVSALTICFLAFDQTDHQFSVEMLSFLLYLLRIKNPVLISSLITYKYTFQTFFSLLVSNSEPIRCQCIHIFILLNQLDQNSQKSLLKPLSQNDWVSAIMLTLNTNGLSSIFADVLFGYMFGLYDIRKNIVMPSIRISQISTNTNGFRFYFSSLFPLCMMIISNFSDELSYKYLIALDRSISCYFNEFINSVSNWDLPFIMFLMHRLPNENAHFDKSSHVCLHTLCNLYQLTMNQGTICNLKKIVITLSSQTNHDYSYIQKHIYTYFIDNFLMKIRPVSVSPFIIFPIMEHIFDYLFIINRTDNFYLPPFQRRDLPKEKRVLFQDLHRNRFNTSIPTIQMIYGTRTTLNGAWLDTELAQRLLHIFTVFQSVFGIQVRVDQMHPLFVFSFVLGIGLHHQFSAFEPYLRFITPRIPADRAIGDIQYNSFISYFSGLIKAYINTPRGHPSHFYMFEQSNIYQQVIMSKLKTRITTGKTIDEFDYQFSVTQNNYAYLILEKYSEIETLVEKYAIKMIDEIKREYSIQNKQAGMLPEIFRQSTFDPSKTLSHLSKRNEQVKLQLYQYASAVKNKRTQSMKVYRSLWRSLSSEGGPWYSISPSSPNSVPSQPHDQITHWKLDLNFNTVLMKRGRFVVNYSFNDHKDASLLRDAGEIDDAQKIYENHLKKIRLSQFAGEPSFITVDDSNDILGEDNKEYDKYAYDISTKSDSDNIILKADANRITMKKVYKGTVVLSKASMSFHCIDSNKKSVVLPLSIITHLFTRRYLLMDTAFEIFTTAKRAYMFNFVTNDDRQKVILEIKKISSMYLPNLKFIQTCERDAIPCLESLRKLWSEGNISNFDYLLQLNLFAGRTYNDLSQYPVFPWVIADYESESLDFDDPKIFRDLSLPVGALDDERLNGMIQRMNENRINQNETSVLDSMDYLYGSFYSSPAVVIGYLIRIEPFTSLHIELQDGKFDHPSRLFNSIPKAFKSVCKTPMDFRELIPEFFYMPDFLVNKNKFDLGKKANDDVELPPWAKSPQEFININRAALESKFVTAMLPRWIDLIFGVNSRGNEARLFNNIFAPYFFETALTPDILNNPAQLKFVQEYAACFGHAPKQIFFEPHKSRQVLQKDLLSIVSPTNGVVSNYGEPTAKTNYEFLILFESKDAIISVEAFQKQNEIVAINLKFEMLRYSLAEITMSKVQLLLNMSLNEVVYSNDKKSKNFNNEDEISSICNTIQIKNNVVLSAVPWDMAITMSSLENGSVLHIKRAHTKSLTAIAASTNFYATASLDCTLIIWKLVSSISQIPLSTMTRHKTYVKFIGLNENVDMCVSVSKGGEIITQSLVTGSFIKKYHVKNLGEPLSIAVFNSGLICIPFGHKNERTTVVSFTQNLELIQTVQLEGIIHCWSVIEWPNEKDYIFAYLKNGSLIIYRAPMFEVIWKYEKFEFVVTSISILYSPLRIFMGMSNGKVMSLSFTE